jgi:hypothetical protein
VQNPQSHEPDHRGEQRGARGEQRGDDDVRRRLGDRSPRVTGYLAALLLTLAVEPPLYAVALRAGLRVPPLRGYLEGLLANATSHPLAFVVLYPLTGESVALVEAFVVAWEAALLRVRLGHDLPLLAGLSLVCNAVSLGLGAAVLR